MATENSNTQSLQFTTKSMLPILVASSASSAISRIVVYPIDTMKAKLQTQNVAKVLFRNTREAMFQTFKHEGIRGFYRGLNIALLGSIPAGCLFFTTYEVSKALITDKCSNQHVVSSTAGFIAEAVSCILWVPIDVIKERLQTQSNLPHHLHYRNALDAIRQIRKHDGTRGLYRGYGATLFSFGPFSALYFMGYEIIKARMEKRVLYLKTLSGNANESPTALGLVHFMGAGAVAGVFAAFVTNPLDLIKLRIQVQRARGEYHHEFAFGYRGILHGLKSVFAQDGFVGLFKGVGARMLFHAPSTALSIGFYEYFRAAITQTFMTTNN